MRERERFRGPQKGDAPRTKNAKRPLKSGLWINEGEPDPSGQKIPRVSSQANASRTGSTDSGLTRLTLRHAALILDGATINPDEPSSGAIRFRREAVPARDPKCKKAADERPWMLKGTPNGRKLSRPHTPHGLRSCVRAEISKYVLRCLPHRRPDCQAKKLIDSRLTGAFGG
jgi:hypothetical protein